MDIGWIKLHRKLLDNPVIMKDGDHLAVWIWLLLHVTYEGTDVLFQGKRHRLAPGQITVGRKQIGAEMNINESKVRRILDSFESDQQIDQQMSNKCRLVTVKNWQHYQKFDQQNDQQVTNNRPTSDQQVTTNKEDKKIRKIRSKEPDLATAGAVAGKTVDPVNVIMEAFQMKINPTINYGNKTERNAIQDLIKTIGMEQLLRTIEYAASVQGEEFAPVITTPYQLKAKFAQLVGFHKKSENKKSGGIIKI